ncbi:MAG: ABC transporter permease [Chloroflexi bacterium]|nr:ABC transporter permease [Chloroflexota bacterium]
MAERGPRPKYAAPLPHSVGRWLPAAGLLLSLLALWELWALAGWTPRWILPSPTDIVAAGVDSFALMLPHIGQTLLETWLGLGLALAGGLALALAIDLSGFLRCALYPLLVASQTIPIMALAPLLIIWFGYGILPKVMVVFLVCFFPIAINTADGLTSVDPEMVALLRSMGASRWAVFTRVRLPAALPGFFTGLKIAITYSVVGAIIGEWVGASKGLGVFMLRASNSFLTARLFAAIAVTSLLSIAMFLLVAGLERLALPWYFSAAKSEQWEEMA